METVFRSNKIKALIVLFFTTHLCFSQKAEPKVDLMVDSENRKVSVTWFDASISEIKVIFPDKREIVFPTLGETQLNMEGEAEGKYVLELIEDNRIRKTLKIEI